MAGSGGGSAEATYNNGVILFNSQKFAEAKVLEKTIFSFGHITAQKSHRGEHLKQKWLREHAEELKRRFPAMPGVAFFQPDCPDTPEQRDLIRFCDQLSAELWPDAKP